MVKHRIIEPLFFARGDVSKGEDYQKAYAKISIAPIEIDQVVITINGVADDPYYNTSRDGQIVTSDLTILSEFHVIKADYQVETVNELAAPLVALSEKLAESVLFFQGIAEAMAGQNSILSRIADVVEVLQQQGDVTVQVEAQKEQESLSLLEQLIAENNIQDAELQPDEATFSDETRALIAEAKALQGITGESENDAGIDFEEGGLEPPSDSGETPAGEQEVSEEAGTEEEPPAEFQEPIE